MLLFLEIFPQLFIFLFPNISVKKCHCSRLPGSCLKVCVWVGDSVLNQSQCNPNLVKVRLDCLSNRGNRRGYSNFYLIDLNFLNLTQTQTDFLFICWYKNNEIIHMTVQINWFVVLHLRGFQYIMTRRMAVSFPMLLLHPRMIMITRM